MTVWLDPETEIKAAWKIQRDTQQRCRAKFESSRKCRSIIIGPHVAEGLRPERLGEFKDGKGITKISYSLALAQLPIARRVVLIENELLEMVP